MPYHYPTLSLDVNECKKKNECNLDNSKCVNTKGSYECRCKKGYKQHGLRKCKGNKSSIIIYGAYLLVLT